MKKFIKLFEIIALATVIGFAMISCDFFKEKDCSHCGGTGEPCWSLTCDYCPHWNDVDSRYTCGICYGSGKVPDW